MKNGSVHKCPGGMSSTKPDSIIFIDANLYLDFYRIPATKTLLRGLAAQKDSIFVTQQIVDEVQRNKLRVATAFLAGKFQPGSDIPDYLFDENTTKSLRNKLKETNAALKKAIAETLERISRSEDDVSNTLQVIFKKAAGETEDELLRARKRKERGNPPGKGSDPLGDELNWEQLVVRAKGKSRLWVITNDSDYFDVGEGKVFLNPLLRQELEMTLRVYCFKKLDEGIRSFAEVTGVGKENLPTEKESQEIVKESEHVQRVNALRDYLQHGNSEERYQEAIKLIGELARKQLGLFLP